MDGRQESPVVPPPPLVSPDGRFYLDDGRWVPLPKPAANSREIARGVANGVGDFLAKLLLAVLVFPIVIFLIVLGVQRIVPEPAEGVASVVTIVVLLGALWCLLRTTD